MAKLWVGTALSKIGRTDAIEHSIVAMRAASETFERLDEPADWSVAQQKLGLAYRARGDFVGALEYIDAAECHGAADSPLRQVRLGTARAHVLLSDAATWSEGMEVIRNVRAVANKYGLRHQVGTIDKICSTGHLN